MNNITQVPITKWPRGVSKAVAVIDSSALEMERVLGVEFERTEDALDECDAAIVELPSGLFFALVDYLNHPFKGVQLWISESATSPSRDFCDALDALKEMRLKLIWIHADVADAGNHLLQHKESA